MPDKKPKPNPERQEKADAIRARRKKALIKRKKYDPNSLGPWSGQYYGGC
jgi:hypothetical protein